MIEVSVARETFLDLNISDVEQLDGESSSEDDLTEPGLLLHGKD